MVDGATVPTLIIEGVGLVVTVITLAITGVWQLGNTREAIMEHVNNKTDETTQSIASLENDFRDRITLSERNTGEAIAGMRNQVQQQVDARRDAMDKLRDDLHDHELHTRDSYISKDTFNLVMDKQEKQIKEYVDDLKRRLDRIELAITARPRRGDS